MTLLSCSGNRVAAGDPVIDDRVVFFQQALELTELFSGELREASIGKGADQQIGLARAAVPSAEAELATERLEHFSIVWRWQGGPIGCHVS
jgi:hypothetical protein